MKVTTLVIHAPDRRVKKDGAKSFEKILADGIGKGYIIFQGDEKKLHPGSKVVLLRNDKNEARAEGVLVRWEPTTKTPRGKQRYDVYIKGLTEVRYEWVEINLCGVAVIGDC